MDDIWQYIADAAHKHGIDRHIRFNTYVRRRLPLRLARWIVRWRNAMFGSLGWLVARKAPEFSKRLARGIAERNTGADLTAQALAKLLAYMDSRGFTHAYPHLGDVKMPNSRH